MLFFKKKTGNSRSGSRAPEEWQDLKWGISSPQMLRLSDGLGKILSEATLEEASRDLNLKGITLIEFKVERIVRA